MAKAEFAETYAIDARKLFETITKYEDYPQFVTGCSTVSVERKAPGQARVDYHVNMIKEVSYILDHIEDAPKDAQGEKPFTVTWKLVKSDFMRTNNGRWTLKPLALGKTAVLYEVEVDFSFPAPSFIVNRMVKASLGPMVKSIVDRAIAKNK
jgi:ribosome-associated toxin RatA of RatAB toxin-antitoxin module